MNNTELQPDILANYKMLNNLIAKCLANTNKDTFPKVEHLFQAFNRRADVLQARIENCSSDLKYMTKIVKELADKLEVIVS